MANLLNVLNTKGKNNSLSIQGTTPVKYDNPIARLNPGKSPQTDPNYLSNIKAASASEVVSSVPPRAS